MSVFNIEEKKIKKQIFNTRSGFLKTLSQEKNAFIIGEKDNFNYQLFESSYVIVSPIIYNKKLVGAILLFDKETRNGVIDFESNGVGQGSFSKYELPNKYGSQNWLATHISQTTQNVLRNAYTTNCFR